MTGHRRQHSNGVVLSSQETPPPSPLRSSYPFDPVTIHAWLINQGLETAKVETIVGGFCDRLLDAGLPLARGYAALATLHPLILAHGYTWARAGRGVAQDQFSHARAGANWNNSPFLYMLNNRILKLNRRLAGPQAVLDFPALQEFSAQGLTDWLGLVYGFGWAAERMRGGQIGLVTSWATDRPEGFTEPELRVLEELMGTLALALKAATAYPIMQGLLDTYLGADAARHVLSGEVQLGTVQRMDAALFFADLRGFTALSDQLGSEAVVGMLNQYLACIGEPVREQGGQILKFMGDGVLATFAIEGAGGQTCDKALEAALDALDRVATLNRERAAAGMPVLELDIALHRGEVMYGNVGTADRLDFTVVGPAVNEAARMEVLCKPLARHLVVSRSFRDATGEAAERLMSLGEHALRDVREAREIFTVVRVPENQVTPPQRG